MGIREEIRRAKNPNDLSLAMSRMETFKDISSTIKNRCYIAAEKRMLELTQEGQRQRQKERSKK